MRALQLPEQIVVVLLEQFARNEQHTLHAFVERLLLLLGPCDAECLLSLLSIILVKHALSKKYCLLCGLSVTITLSLK